MHANFAYIDVMIRSIVIISSFLLLYGRGISQKNFHAWASTPPMGWNSWDCFGPTVTESEVKNNADYMESLVDEGAERRRVIGVGAGLEVHGSCCG